MKAATTVRAALASLGLAGFFALAVGCGGDGGDQSKGDAKSTVAIEHTRLPDAAAAAREKPLWRERLAELKRLVEA